MKRFVLGIVLSFLLLGIIGCNELETTTVDLTTEITTVEPTTEVTIEEKEFIQVIIGEDSFQLEMTDTESSVLDLIDTSEISLDYISTDFGPMITGVNGFQQDDFHWIGFTKNDEFASEGLHTIAYQDGDVFEFTENLSTWSQDLELTYLYAHDDYYLFEVNNSHVLINSSSLTDMTLIENGIYNASVEAISEDDLGVYVNVTEINPSFDGVIDIVIGDETYQLTFTTDMIDELSVLDLIDLSDISIKYVDTTYGPMVTQIGSLQNDQFHWIGYTINNETAMEGLNTISYSDGDVFEFTDNFLFTTRLTAELLDIEEDYLLFGNSFQEFIVNTDSLPETWTVNDFNIGFIYMMSGDIDQTSMDQNVLIPNEIEIDVIKDFTELYYLEVSQVFLLQFTVTFIEESSEFGFEIFAEDINGVLSKDISNNMRYPSSTNYIFYTIPDGYLLEVGKTYIGRFIYQVNEPSTIPQLTLYEYNRNGEPISQVIKGE